MVYEMYTNFGQGRLAQEALLSAIKLLTNW